MTFVLSKLVWFLLAPANLLALCLTAGAGMLFARGDRTRATGRALVVGGAVALLVCGVLPVGAWLATPLENRFPIAGVPARVDGILLLGGAAEPDLTAARGALALNGAAERVLAFADLARRHPEARLVASGGSAALRDDRHREDGPMRLALVQAGVDPGRVVFETGSRNTWENAALSRSLAAPRPGETWVLVTSAAHMPRAVGVFRRLGWPVVPHPVDFRTAGAYRALRDFDVAEGLQALDGAAREWIGLVAYRLLGRTDALFPAPGPGPG